MTQESNTVHDSILVPRIRISEGFALHRTACGFVVFDMRCLEPVLELNETGAVIWSLFIESPDPETVIRRISHETGADTVSVRSDVGEFVNELIGRELFRVEVASRADPR